MISIYMSTETGLITLTEPIEGSWINVIDPTPEEHARLEKLGIPRDYIINPLDIDERPRVERENGELLIVLRVPFFNGKGADIPYSTIPMGIVLTEQYLLTVCKQDNVILQDMVRGRARGLSTPKRYRFVLRLLLLTATTYLNYLREITKIVDILEDQLQLSTRNREVYELLKYQKSLTYFTTALKSNELMMERLQRSSQFKTFPEDEDLLEDVITENQQAIEMTNITSNILSSMMDAFASIISNNLNGVMKFLASITIILSLPTLIASFYGMNVKLPFMTHPLAFLFTVVLSMAIAFAVGLFFAKKDWL